MKWSIACLMLSAAVAFAADTEHGINATLKKSDDKAAISSTSNAVIVSVSSASGIGSCRLTVSNQWSASIIIRLSVGMLESFSIKTPAHSANGSLAHPGDLTIRKVGEYMEILVPPDFLKGKPEYLDFEWIDAYRG